MGDLTEHFSLSELCCRCVNCDHEMGWSSEGLARLEYFRNAWGSPIVPTSSFRCSRHPLETSKDEPGSHSITDDGNICVDVRVSGADARDLVELAVVHQVPGIGISQAGEPERRFVHLDWAPDRPKAPRPAIWSYRD